LQSKHTGGAQACCSDNDFKTHMKGEVKKVKKLIADKELSHYVLLLIGQNLLRRTRRFGKSFGTLTGMSEAWLVGIEHIHQSYAEHGDIWDRYEEDVRTHRSASITTI